ncbi:hypothetical protein EDF66_11265 [Sphingobacterium sp. JUb20]|nr:hypothetical protein [Sphingobacterium sp. JUb21]TCR00221.1 hypothetical protein EDF66_11265 [Sphingobacterium sp. JUb20]
MALSFLNIKNSEQPILIFDYLVYRICCKFTIHTYYIISNIIGLISFRLILIIVLLSFRKIT